MSGVRRAPRQRPTHLAAVDEKSLAERAAMMHADGNKGEQFTIASNKKRRLTMCMPDQHGSIGSRRELDSPGKVGSAEFRFILAHLIHSGADT